MQARGRPLWLWLLGAFLLYWVPSTSLQRGGAQLQVVTGPLSDKFPAYTAALGYSTVVWLLLGVFSAAAAIGLWSLRPAGLRTARAYFITQMALTFPLALWPLFVGLPTAERNAVLREQALWALLTGLFVGYWMRRIHGSPEIRTMYAPPAAGNFTPPAGSASGQTPEQE